VQIAIAPNSERLQLLQPFPRWDGRDFAELPILVKTKGKTTTDHISPAGAWLRFRGHSTASATHVPGRGQCLHRRGGQGRQPDHRRGQTFTANARDLKAKGISWIVIGDENTTARGRARARRHAPRYLAAKVVSSRVRAHPRDEPQEAGDLPLTFAKTSTTTSSSRRPRQRARAGCARARKPVEV